MEDNSLEDRDLLVEDLLRMLERGSPIDMKVKLSDGEITANKDMLMTRSKYFSLTLPRKVGGTSAVDISHCSDAIMGKIIRFLFITFHHMSTIKERGAQLMRETSERKVLKQLILKESASARPRTIFSRKRTSKTKAQEGNRGLK